MVWTLLSRWFGSKPRSDLRVVVFTRKDCKLCDEAWELLQRYQRRHGFTLEATDIDASPDLVREHGDWVPVVAINGQVRFRGRVNEVLLQRFFAAS